ncbi:MAG: Plasmid stabilization system protein [Gammaproteobacteria bacterium]|nr:Plasmid stabilization system protein [Gammaproteobacteria bacterium]
MEFREAVAYYESQNSGLGKLFRDEVYEAVERIKRYPNAWTPLSGDIRRCRTQRFPYGLIYEATGSEILIIAVAHMHRRPEYWQNRK